VLPDLSSHNIPERGKKDTKRSQNIPKGHKIDQMAIKCTNIFHIKTLQNLDLGFKKYHLAILLGTDLVSAVLGSVLGSCVELQVDECQNVEKSGHVMLD
jgi:hypothetical protein